jgi:hypothetical protein
MGMSERMLLRIGLVSVMAVVLAAGCGGGHRTGTVPAARVAKCAAGSVRQVGDDRVAWAAVAIRPTAAYREPGGRLISRFGLVNVNRFPTVFGVLAERVDARCRATWLRVELPLRPNGSTGWVRARDVDRAPVRARITVDLSERRVRVYEDGSLVLTSRAAIGSSATPTPLGRYYVNQRLVPADPGGPFGPGAVGISAFSPVLTGWAQGGPIALHGTNEPWSIGSAVSNGCIRLPNDVLRRLWKIAVAGTPVLIRD